MTTIAILINNIRYSQWNPLEEGLLTSFVLASERSLACRLLSLLTAVAVLLLSAVMLVSEGSPPGSESDPHAVQVPARSSVRISAAHLPG